MAPGVLVRRDCERGNVTEQLWIDCKTAIGKITKSVPEYRFGRFHDHAKSHAWIIEILAGRGTAENPMEMDGGSTRRAPTHEEFQKPVKGSIPTIIRSYKAAVSYRINLMRGTQDVPVWQRNYYEHVIRNEKDLQNKTDYIIANPLLWEQDNENPENIIS